MRELENCIARALLLAAGDEITHHDIAPLLEGHGRSAPTVMAGDTVSLLHENGQRKTMQELEAEIITHTLAAFNQAVPKAAAMLGIGQSTIYRKLAERDRK